MATTTTTQGAGAGAGAGRAEGLSIYVIDSEDEGRRWHFPTDPAFAHVDPLTASLPVLAAAVAPLLGFHAHFVSSHFTVTGKIQDAPLKAFGHWIRFKKAIIKLKGDYTGIPGLKARLTAQHSDNILQWRLVSSLASLAADFPKAEAVYHLELLTAHIEPARQWAIKETGSSAAPIFSDLSGASPLAWLVVAVLPQRIFYLKEGYTAIPGLRNKLSARHPEGQLQWRLTALGVDLDQEFSSASAVYHVDIEVGNLEPAKQWIKQEVGKDEASFQDISGGAISAKLVVFL